MAGAVREVPEGFRAKTHDQCDPAVQNTDAEDTLPAQRYLPESAGPGALRQTDQRENLEVPEEAKGRVTVVLRVTVRDLFQDVNKVGLSPPNIAIEVSTRRECLAAVTLRLDLELQPNPYKIPCQV